MKTAKISHLSPEEELKSLEQKINRKGSCGFDDLMRCENCTLNYDENMLCLTENVMKWAEQRQEEIKAQLDKLNYLEGL